MKKICKVILILMLCIGLAGCSSKSEDDQSYTDKENEEYLTIKNDFLSGKKIKYRFTSYTEIDLIDIDNSLDSNHLVIIKDIDDILQFTMQMDKKTRKVKTIHMSYSLMSGLESGIIYSGDKSVPKDDNSILVENYKIILASIGISEEILINYVEWFYYNSLMVQ